LGNLLRDGEGKRGLATPASAREYHATLPERAYDRVAFGVAADKMPRLNRTPESDRHGTRGETLAWVINAGNEFG
jgi:hypothetical protein